MELNEDDYILGMWYASNSKGDWQATVRKKHGKGDWELEYRFRDYKDDKVFDSKDEKRWTVGCKDGSIAEQVVWDSMNKMYEVIKTRYPLNCSVVEVRGDVKRFMYLIAQEDFVHVKHLPAEERS